MRKWANANSLYEVQKEQVDEQTKLAKDRETVMVIFFLIWLCVTITWVLVK